MIRVRYREGVELPDYGFWLDPRVPKEFAFVSHAHSDHIGKHAEVVLSKGTARLMQVRMGGKRIEHLMEFGETRVLRDMRITLLPAGHIFGSAQIHVETATGSLLYTGDFKLRPGLSSEPIEWRHAETLVMETTYGLPKYRFPPTDEVVARMVEFCVETLEEGGVPVLFGYSLGKSQEILCALASAGLTPMLHYAVRRMTEVYRRLQPDFPGYEPFDPLAVEGKVLIFPPSASRSRMLTRIPNRRTASLTGWALDPGARYWTRSDAAFPLSDHADYDDLLKYVDLVQPQRVLTLHGFAAAFARDLRARGIEAWALSQENQLELSLPATSAPEKATVVVAEQPPPAESGFAQLAELCKRIAATSARTKKIELLVGYLRLLDDESLPIAAVYLTGRAFPQNDPRTLQVGWAIIRRALLAASGLGEIPFRELVRSLGDAGKAARLVMQGRSTPRPFGLGESREFFETLEAARGPLVKTDILQNRLKALTALEAELLVRVITGDLRIGLKEGLLEEAIATACGVEAGAVRESHMLLGDIGKTAHLARQKALNDAALTMFQPIKCMLASPEESAELIWKRAGAVGSVWVEDKYDGIRAQLHRGPDRTELYSRDLRRITDQFPELANAASKMKTDAILDGEIIAFEQGRKLTFQDLQKRLGRTTPDLFLGEDIPVRFVVFDLLALDGQSLLKRPLSVRRTLLESLALPVEFETIAVRSADSVEAIEAAFGEARRRGNEGLIVKDPASHYTPGRRGHAWLKLKKAAATLDVVVVGAEQGHGKRSDVLSDYTFAVRHDRTGELLTIGKAYTGLTDREIEELTEHFEANTVERRGRYRVVHPDVVLEIAFDAIRPSKRHRSGLALRFPRIKAIRRDKTSGEIDMLSYAERLARM